MVLPIVRYGHPALRTKGERVGELTPEVRQLVTDMLDTMYAAEGIGLAAQQVGRPVQLTVLDVRGVKERPSTLQVGGEWVDVDSRMPMILINPEVEASGARVVGPEGCLSFPEIYADIERLEEVQVRAVGMDGKPWEFRCGGLLARAVQHEVDHLNGILFIDRMSRAIKEGIRGELEALKEETREELEVQERVAKVGRVRKG
jgi:peptide deformylase